MGEKFSYFPSILQKQIFIRLTACIVMLLMLVLIWLSQGGIVLILPSIGFSAAFFISALQLYVRCKKKHYVVIKGTCAEIEKTGLRRKVKDIYVKEAQFTIRIVRPAMKLRTVNVGDRITIYLADNTPVYEMDGCKVICNTLAVVKEF